MSSGAHNHHDHPSLRLPDPVAEDAEQRDLPPGWMDVIAKIRTIRRTI
jgi:hypothetical protein